MMKLSRGLLFSLSTSILWAIGIVANRFLLNAGENPLNLVFWVSLCSFPFWLVVFRKHLHEYQKLSAKNKGLLIFIGIAGSIGISYLQSLALQHTTAVNFSFLYRMIVVFTIIFAWIFFKEKITAKKLIIVTLILIGSYFLTTKGQELNFGLGDIYTLLMALSTALIANILIKHTTSKMHPDLSGAAAAIVATVSLFLLSFFTRVVKIPQNIFLIFIMGLIYFFQIRTRNNAYKVATASFVTMIVSLTPVFVSLLSFPLLGERLEAIQMIGGILIISSGFLAEKLKI